MSKTEATTTTREGSMSKIKISRRGFRNAPAAIEQPASRSLAEFIRATGSTTVLAQLRPATYCGPGSGGDRGSWILDVSGDGPDGYRHALHIIEAA